MKATTLTVALAATLSTACASPLSTLRGGSRYAGDRAGLVDNSARVESVQGENPRRYFIANLPALNAVDKDANGIWDDIEAALNARLATEPDVVKNMDRRPLLQVVRSDQNRMQYLTSAQARAEPVSLFSYAVECIQSLQDSGAIPKTLTTVNGAKVGALDYITSIATEVAVTTKERALAMRYADMLASGGVFSLPAKKDRGMTACTK